jgi:hypothetical protein
MVRIKPREQRQRRTWCASKGVNKLNKEKGMGMIPMPFEGGGGHPVS